MDRPLEESGVGPNQDPFQIGQAVQGQFGQVLPMSVAVERCIQVGPRVGHHLDLANVELGAWGVVGTELLSTQEIADQRGGKSPIGHHPMLDDMAYIHQNNVSFNPVLIRFRQTSDLGIADLVLPNRVCRQGAITQSWYICHIHCSRRSNR